MTIAKRRAAALAARALSLALSLALTAAGCGKDPAAVKAPRQSAGRAATAIERTHAAPLPAAYHEFQLFGKDRIYLSHYPMFASIHAYQVVIEAKLHGAEAEIAAFRAKSPGTPLTVSPSSRTDAALPQREDWVLPIEVVPGGRFNADVHWVADGDDFADPKARHYVARNVEVEVVRVIRKQMFYPDTPKSQVLSYLVVGTPGDLHLVHLLDRHPDFDQVLSVTASGAAPADGTVVTIPGRANTPDGRLKPGQDASATAGSKTFALKVDAETGFEELEMQH